MLSEVLEIYAKDGLTLRDNGLKEAVISINASLEVLELFTNFNILILGGDIYEKQPDGSFKNAYTDWYYEGDCALESIEVAKSFLSKINSDLFVSFVFNI